MKPEEKIDIYNEVDNFVEENEGEVTNTEIARHFFELGRNNTIDKACDYLERALPLRPDDRDEFVEQFKQAMKGE